MILQSYVHLYTIYSLGADSTNVDTTNVDNTNAEKMTWIDSDNAGQTGYNIAAR